MMLPLVVAAQAADPTYAAAVEARAAGRTLEAVAAFEALSRARPNDADVWLNLGLSYIAAERFDEADRALETSLRLAPDYVDARLAYARSALFRGQRDLARERLSPLLGRDRPEVQALSRQIEASGRETPWRLDVAYARSALSADLGHWTFASVSLGRRLRLGSAGVAVEYTDRFGREDVYVEALGTRSFARGASAWLALGGTPDADYRPEIALRGGGAFVAGRSGPWTMTLGADAAWSRYPVGSVRSLQPYLTAAWSERVSVTARSYNTLDENDDYRSGYGVRAEWIAAPRLQLAAGWADAPESDVGRTVEVQAVSLGAALDLTESLTLRASYVHEMRDAYDRDELALSLTGRF